MATHGSTGGAPWNGGPRGLKIPFKLLLQRFCCVRGSSARCKEIGLKIENMEDDQKLQDAILTLHHACVHTLMHTPAYKIIENQNGTAFIRTVQSVQIILGMIPRQ